MPDHQPPTRILVVEDDRDIAELVRRYLEKAGFSVEIAAAGPDAIARIGEKPPDLLVLDLMLPGASGLDICRFVRTREATADLPIVMLTARAEESERIAGLEIGADDYIAKPFSPNELVARVRALMRRVRRRSGAKALEYGMLVIQPDEHTVVCDGRPITLTAKEYLLLKYFMAHRGRVLSRDVLLTDVWGYAFTGGTRTVDVHVRRLRQKLPFLQQALVTVKQFGYKLLERPPE